MEVLRLNTAAIQPQLVLVPRDGPLTRISPRCSHLQRLQLQSLKSANLSYLFLCAEGVTVGETSMLYYDRLKSFLFFCAEGDQYAVL